MGGNNWGYGDGSGSGEYNPQWRMLVAEASGSTAAGRQLLLLGSILVRAVL
jgi:hypothetical protein